MIRDPYTFGITPKRDICSADQNLLVVSGPRKVQLPLTRARVFAALDATWRNSLLNHIHALQVCDYSTGLVVRDILSGIQLKVVTVPYLALPFPAPSLRTVALLGFFAPSIFNCCVLSVLWFLIVFLLSLSYTALSLVCWQ